MLLLDPAGSRHTEFRNSLPQCERLIDKTRQTGPIGRQIAIHNDQPHGAVGSTSDFRYDLGSPPQISAVCDNLMNIVTNISGVDGSRVEV